MKKKRFSEAQIIKVLKEYDMGKKVDDICREHGVSKASFYKWRQRYSGMDVSQLKELKALQEENRRLKHMYADLSLDHSLLKEIVEKKL